MFITCIRCYALQFEIIDVDHFVEIVTWWLLSFGCVLCLCLPVYQIKYLFFRFIWTWGKKLCNRTTKICLRACVRMNFISSNFYGNECWMCGGWWCNCCFCHCSKHCLFHFNPYGPTSRRDYSMSHIYALLIVRLEIGDGKQPLSRLHDLIK